MENNYAQAIVDLLEEGVDSDMLFSRLPDILKKNGHQALHTKIVKAIRALYLRRQKNTHPVVAVAKEKDLVTLKSKIEDTLHSLGATAVRLHTIIDPTLVGGYTVLYKNRAVDLSQKKTLLSVYNQITN